VSASRPPLAFSLPLTGVDAREGVEVAKEAEHRGFSACWAAEVQGPDAFTTLGALAVTTDLDLGVAVVPAQTRSPFVLGMTARSLAELSGDRFTLGIGASSEVIVGRWAGIAFDKPLTHVRETVEAIRPMLAGEKSTFEGELVSVGGYKPHRSPAERVPLVLGALNPRSCRMVGELGVDGICLNQLGPSTCRWCSTRWPRAPAGAAGGLHRRRAPVLRGDRRRAGHAPDRQGHLRQLHRHLGVQQVLPLDGLRGRRRRRARGQGARRPRGHGAAVTDELVDDLFCLGTADEVASKVADYCEAG
jgi:alkanesulfonate monooxygenase SsuD/methylene tetrahydromethanopterin reductase-like flavin-dependent oxidoreductase (luciferase family)